MPTFGEPTPDPGPDGASSDDAGRDGAGAGGWFPDGDLDEPARAPRRPAREVLADLDLHPELLDLARRGWQLDGLPTTSVAVPFLATLLLTLIAFGALAAGPVVVTAVVAGTLAGAALAVDDVAAARATLVSTRAIMIAWGLLTALAL